MLAALAAREGACVELARELVATPSPNPPGDERAIAAVVQQAMAALGYRDLTTIACAEERPNGVGVVGTGPRTLILNGHLDTKPPGNEGAWQTGPYDPVIRDGRLYGLGSTDMKGAVAAMIYAGAALAEAADLAGTLRLVLSADEEAGSVFGARFLAETRAVTGDAVLVGEPTGFTSAWEYLAVASRGISCFRVVVRGTQMHSSLSDRLPAVNASVQLARVLIRLSDELELPEGATLNVGVTLRGGIFWGVYPGEAEAGVEVRTVPGMTFEGLPGWELVEPGLAGRGRRVGTRARLVPTERNRPDARTRRCRPAGCPDGARPGDPNGGHARVHRRIALVASRDPGDPGLRARAAPARSPT